MHPNYRFVLEKCETLLTSKKGRVLDYGCGAGGIVIAGRERGLDVFGAEVFYDGENTRSLVREAGLLGNEIREIVSAHIPFPDGYFDLVVSNQVLEHAPDLGAVLKEIQRVLRPGGKFCCLFPSIEV